MVMWGYARVSTADQDPGLQHDALVAAGVEQEHLITDHASGVRSDRPGLGRLLGQLEPGDVLVVWKLDRLGRSLAHLVGLISELGDRGVEFRSLTESMLDTTTPSGRLLFSIIGAFAAFERDLIAERTRAGLQRARAAGKPLGRPSRVQPRQHARIHELHAQGVAQTLIAEETGLSRQVVGRVLRGEIASLAWLAQGDALQHDADLVDASALP
ncbi:recombinase family protein [Propioniciclava coleopterorum]|uniref:Recombinase family protein n=2 Tax=Propioniciclava coleopterorum TaxID=2714937 RepID=A0A6G7YB37_9ACTN|nr:recombinase family protein [Propioniciclava coleopterorum]